MALKVDPDALGFLIAETARMMNVAFERKIANAGLDITLRQYPGGQRLCREMLADANRWIMDLVTGG